MLQKCRLAATRWAELINASDELTLLMAPQLDIIVAFPAVAGEQRVRRSPRCTHRIFEAGMMEGPDAFFLAKSTSHPRPPDRPPRSGLGSPALVGLRSVLMKPEHLRQFRAA